MGITTEAPQGHPVGAAHRHVDLGRKGARIPARSAFAIWPCSTSFPPTADTTLAPRRRLGDGWFAAGVPPRRRPAPVGGGAARAIAPLEHVVVLAECYVACVPHFERMKHPGHNCAMRPDAD
eukprot:gene13223-biopygen8635